MARPDEVKAVKAFRSAKTGEEIIRSWAYHTPGRKVDALVDLMKVYSDDPKIGFPLLKRYAQDPLADIMDRGIFDRKTRELIMIGILMTMDDSIGVSAHVQNALAAGATKEEFMEVCALVCYEIGKGAMGRTCVYIDQALKTASTNNVKLYDYANDTRNP